MDVFRLKEQAGHSSLTMLDRYVHASTEQTRNDLNKLGELVNKLTYLDEGDLQVIVNK